MNSQSIFAETATSFHLWDPVEFSGSNFYCDFTFVIDDCLSFTSETWELWWDIFFILGKAAFLNFI